MLAAPLWYIAVESGIMAPIMMTVVQLIAR